MNILRKQLKLLLLYKKPDGKSHQYLKEKADLQTFFYISDRKLLKIGDFVTGGISAEMLKTTYSLSSSQQSYLGTVTGMAQWYNAKMETLTLLLLIYNKSDRKDHVELPQYETDEKNLVREARWVR